MAESPTELPVNMEALEPSDDGRRKFKFKSIRNLFGKRKKKDSEDTPSPQRGRRLQPSLSSSNISISCLKAANEGSPNEFRAKTHLGSKALSHDSVFVESEPERSASTKYGTSDIHGGKQQQRVHMSQTLPRIGTGGGIYAAEFDAMPPYKTRSGSQAPGSQAPEALSPRPGEVSPSPTLMKSHVISQDLETISAADELPKGLPKTSLRKTIKKNSAEQLSEPTHFTTCALLTSASSTQAASFGTPATTLGCLDSSAARHKINVNPRKQKKNQSIASPSRGQGINPCDKEHESQLLQCAPEEVVKRKQENPIYQLLTEDDINLMKARQDDQKTTDDDTVITGSLIQGQNNQVQLYEKKTTNQGAADSDEYSVIVTAEHMQGSKAFGTTDSGSIGRSLLKSHLRVSISDETRSLPTKSSKEQFWQQLMEKSTVGPYVTAASGAITPQDKVKKRKSNVGFESRKTSPSQLMSGDKEELMIESSHAYSEEKDSGADKTRAKSNVSLLTLLDNLSADPEDDFVSVAMDSHVSDESSHFLSEEISISSLDFQNLTFKMESVQDLPSASQDKSSVSIYHSFTTSESSKVGVLAEENIPTKNLSQRTIPWTLEKHEDELFMDSSSTSKSESDSLFPLTTGYSFYSTKITAIEQVSPGLEVFSVPPNTPEQKIAPGFYTESSEDSKFEEILVKSITISEEVIDSEEILTVGYTFPYLKKSEEDPEIFVEAKDSDSMSTPEKQLSARGASQISKNPEEIFTETDSFVEKYNSIEDWSSSEEGISSKSVSNASEKPEDELKVSLNPKSLPDEENVSDEHKYIDAEERKILGEPSSHPVQLQVSPEKGKQVCAFSESITFEWDIAVEPLPPRTIFKQLLKPKSEQKVMADVETMPPEAIASVELQTVKEPPQASLQEGFKSEMSTVTESTTVEGSISLKVMLPKSSPQSLVVLEEKPEAKKNPEAKSTLGEKTPAPTQSLDKSIVQLEGFDDSKGTVKDDGISGNSPSPVLPLKSLVSPNVEQKVPLEEKTVVEGKSFLVTSPPKILIKSSITPKTQQIMLSDLEGVATQKTIAIEPVLSKYSLVAHSSQNPVDEKEKLVGEPLPKCPASPLGKSKVQSQSAPLRVVGSSVKSSKSKEPLSSKNTFPRWRNPSVKRQVSTISEIRVREAEKSNPKEAPMSQQYMMSWDNPSPEQVSVSSKRAAEEWGISVEPLPPRTRSVASVRSESSLKKPPRSKSASSVWPKSEQPMPPISKQPIPSKSEQPMPPKSEQPMPPKSEQLMPPKSEQPIPPKSEQHMPPKSEQPMPPGNSWTSTKAEKKISATPERAVKEQDEPEEQMTSRSPLDTILKVISKQTMAAGPESITTEKAMSTETPRRQLQSAVRAKIQHVENMSKEEVISEKPALPKYSAPLSVKSQEQKMATQPRSAEVEGDTLPSKPPSQSFVKYIAQRIFSEPASEEAAQKSSSNKPSKHALSSKAEYKVSSSWDNVPFEKRISTKPRRRHRPSKSLVKLEDLHDAYSQMEIASAKKGTEKEQLPLKHLPKALGKAEYPQDEKLPKYQKSSEDKLPTGHPLQAEKRAEFQSQKFPRGSVSSSTVAEERLLPKHPWQTLAKPESNQPVQTSSVSAAAEGANSEGNLSSCYQAKSTLSPSKTKKHDHSSEDIVKNIPTPKEVLKKDNEHTTCESDVLTHMSNVENIFGVRLRKVSKNYKSENQESHFKFPVVFKEHISSSVAEEQKNKSALQSSPSSPEDLTKVAGSTEMPQSIPKPESMLKKEDQYKISAKSYSRKAGHAASPEPAWVAMVKQKQRSFQQEPKLKSRVGANIEPKHEQGDISSPRPMKMYTPPAGTTEQKIALVKQLKTTLAGIEEKKGFPTTELKKQPRMPSTSIKPRKPKPPEPVWFSMAKKKSEAWSNIADKQ
ncbi:acrosomal protein KIAA1210 homolog [Suncus etruscus]|uniref:acrosomal protein KIAA1210 homolog n=1 Tax=Suncus etruscus TaxID=109475 RepID=UPI00210FDA8B|nr:acrosomal protein KIAA1210 homolog [Suncus etruscus]